MAILAIYTNGTKGKIATIKDKNCINDITGISIEKSDMNITVRNNGGPRLGEVSELWVKSGLRVNYSLGITPGSEIIWTDNSTTCLNHVTVDAHLKNGVSWRIADEEVDTSFHNGFIRVCENQYHST